MELGLVPKLDIGNKIRLKTFDDDVKSADYDVIVVFLIYGQFRAIQKSGFGYKVCKNLHFH